MKKGQEARQRDDAEAQGVTWQECRLTSSVAQFTAAGGEEGQGGGRWSGIRQRECWIRRQAVVWQGCRLTSSVAQLTAVDGSRGRGQGGGMKKGANGRHEEGGEWKAQSTAEGEEGQGQGQGGGMKKAQGVTWQGCGWTRLGEQ